MLRPPAPRRSRRMPDQDVTRATRLLLETQGSDDAGASELMALVVDKLRGIADGYLRRERADHTLQPTALVHEAYLRLIDSTVIQSSDRNRFLGFAARAMRQVLVDHARRRGAEKRGGASWERVTLHPELAIAGRSEVDLVELDEVLERFGAVDARAARVVDLRFFAGLTAQEAADVLGVSKTTVDDDWYMAKAWLGRKLAPEEPT
jgi:RNA polymerase sigma-70 factor (ECF subfamily)